MVRKTVLLPCLVESLSANARNEAAARGAVRAQMLLESVAFVAEAIFRAAGLRKVVHMSKTQGAGPALLVVFFVVSAMGVPTAAATKEAFVAYISDYPTGISDLPECANNGADIATELDNEGGWSRTTTSNTQTLEAHWKDSAQGGSDDTNTDTADMAYFCGHGGLRSTCNCDSIISFKNNVETRELWGFETMYGEVDLEGVTWDASHSLYIDDPNNNANLWNWYDGFSGLHMELGWHSSPLDTDSGFQFFDSMLDTGAFDGGGYQIKYSWNVNHGGCSGNSGGAYQTIMTEDTTFGDEYIDGEGTGPDADASHDGTMYYWGNQC